MLDPKIPGNIGSCGKKNVDNNGKIACKPYVVWNHTVQSAGAFPDCLKSI